MSDTTGWTLSKIDLRSPVMDNADPVARLELYHPVRGRVTDIGKAPGAFDAAYIAAGHILGIAPRLLSYTVTSSYCETDSALSIRIEVELQLGEARATGGCGGLDLLRCSMMAWLEAAQKLMPA
ncbi:MAG: hypothetical protein ABIR77_03345 [Sphingomicrobium sp.]